MTAAVAPPLEGERVLPGPSPHGAEATRDLRSHEHA